ncbi:hypothetical protein FAZ69_20845 [Trinickia terrae]|uniref:Uncharacterized protein n=1 Tax=Trinickia terrae TaxID=2571161 RepID=A0A4U1HZS2_9BURK|nr:hypothetical protein [Trinickia terrae]TKC86304.1 hypothetical protein FAZ69_20845 [Trinickia terrae]
MPETTVGDAPRCLEAGALGIGENHTQPGGRQLAIELISSGRVTHLFVELAHMHYGKPLENAQEIADQGGDIDAVQMAAPSGNLHQENPIPLSRVIATALTQKVKVHLADHIVMAYHAEDFARRHDSIREAFRTVTEQSPDAAVQAVDERCAGCLLLWGGAHFEKKYALDKYIVNLPFIKMG